MRLLESGQVLYKAIDLGYPEDRVSNCIHALGDVVEGYRPHLTPLSWGETASYAILIRLMPWILDPCTVHTWVSTALGLNAYPIVYRRPCEHPRSGVLRGPLSRLLGRGRDAQATYGAPW